MQTITTIDLDIAKSVFQVHGVDAEDKIILRRQLKRRCVLAFFQKLPPPDWYRSPRLFASLVARTSGPWPHCSPNAAGLRETYVKREKNDTVDAEAICEAVTTANMKFMVSSNCSGESLMQLRNDCPTLPAPESMTRLRFLTNDTTFTADEEVEPDHRATNSGRRQ